MAKGRLLGRVEAVLGLIGIIALVVTYSLLTGWNPLPKVGSWLANATKTSLAKPAPPWTARAGDQPESAAVLPNVIVVTAAGSVEARSPGDGKRLWTLVDSWAAAGGGARPVVVVGRQVGGGFDVRDAMTGARLWSDGSRDAVWPYQDMILVMHCAHGIACTLYANEPRSGHHLWSLPVPGAASSMHGLGEPFAALRPINGDYTKSLGAVPHEAPPLIGLRLDRDIHVISTASGRELRVYPANRERRVVVAGRDVIITTAQSRSGACAFTIEARDPSTNATLWSRTGYNPQTSGGLSCEQRTDPKGAGGVLLASDADGHDVLMSLGAGNIVYRAPSRARVIATDGGVAVVRLADRKTLQAVSAKSGAPLWRRGAGAHALVGVGPNGVMIVDPAGNRLVVTTRTDGGVLVNAKSGATILGVGPGEIIVSIGRSYGPILVPSAPAVHP